MNESPRPTLAGSVPRVFTRVRLSPRRVAVDTPDLMVAMFTLPIAILLLLGLFFSGPPDAWLWALAIVLLGGLGPRMHLRVSPGRVIVVRTVASVPWWITVCRPRYDEDFERMDFDGYYLVVPTRAEPSPLEDKTLVLSAMDHGVGEEAIGNLARAARTALGRRADVDGG